MKPAGYYRCTYCKGKRTVENITVQGSKYVSQESETVTCPECNGSGEVYYDSNGETDSDRVQRRLREEEKRPNGGYYHPQKTCLPYNTLIDTPSGKVRIGELKKGQLILSYDKGMLVPRVITRKRVRGMAPIIRVELENGKTLLATGHHTFLTTSGWQKLVCIRPGDKIISSDAHTLTVRSLSTQKAEPVFNIYIAGEHTFIAEGCVAHNFTEFRALRTILHQMFLDPISKIVKNVYV